MTEQQENDWLLDDRREIKTMTDCLKTTRLQIEESTLNLVDI